MSHPIRIFVGCDPNNCDLEQMMVLDYSLHKHTQHSLEIVWMQLSRDPDSPWYSDPNTLQGWRTEKWATPFSGFRWAIPAYCHYEGRAIYMDTDVIVLSDIAKLWEQPIEGDAIVMAKGGKSSARLCTCLWDNAKARNFLPDIETLKSNPDSHKQLMQKIKDQPQLVQPYTDSYNCIDGENLPVEQIKILHYSDMGTQFSHKYALPRLQESGQTHWFDGKILPHPRKDLTELFDQYYAEALAAGYKPENYQIPAFGTFYKASQARYKGNQVTRHQGKSWLSSVSQQIKSLFSSQSSKNRFSLDD